MNICRNIPILAVILFVFASSLVYVPPAVATTPSYSAEVTVTGFSSPTWITRGGGFIWVSENSGIKKVDEATGTISATYSLNSTPREIVFDGTNVFAILENSRIAKITVATGVVSYSASAVCSSGTNNDSIAANADVILVSCFMEAAVARYRNSDLGQIERVYLAAAGRSVIANNFGYVTQFSGLNPTWKYSLSSLSSPTSIATSNHSNSYHRVTADSNYVWVLSANTGLPIKLVRISLSNNSVTTITLTNFNSNSFGYNSLSSDGTTLFITMTNTVRVIAVDIATSAVTTLFTPASTPNGIQAVTNGFWVVVGSNLVKYSSASTPAAPTLNSVTAGDRRITVAFTAGADNGAAITDYEYSLNGGAYISAGTTTSPLTISALSGRTLYSVTLKARNSVGLSVASSSLSATTTDASLDASEAATAEAARVAAAAEAARITAATIEAAKKAKEQKELTELLSVIPSIAGLALNLGDLTNSLLSTKCTKGKTIKYVKKGAKCPKGFVKRK